MYLQWYCIVASSKQAEHCEVHFNLSVKVVKMEKRDLSCVPPVKAHQKLKVTREATIAVLHKLEGPRKGSASDFPSIVNTREG